MRERPGRFLGITLPDWAAACSWAGGTLALWQAIVNGHADPVLVAFARIIRLFI